MNIILTILILLTASTGWALDNGQRSTNRTGHPKGLYLGDGTILPLQNIREDYLKLEAENKKLKGELSGYKIANEELKKKLEAYESTSTIHIFSRPECCEKYGHCYFKIQKGSYIHNKYLEDTEYLHGKGISLSVISNYWDEMCRHCNKRRRKQTETKWIEEE